MQKVTDLPQMRQCGECGLVFSDTSQHECPAPEEVPAEQRRPSNYGNVTYTILSRSDKEQMDRIEKKLDKLSVLIGG